MGRCGICPPGAGSAGSIACVDALNQLARALWKRPAGCLVGTWVFAKSVTLAPVTNQRRLPWPDGRLLGQNCGNSFMRISKYIPDGTYIALPDTLSVVMV